MTGVAIFLAIGAMFMAIGVAIFVWQADREHKAAKNKTDGHKSADTIKFLGLEATVSTPSLIIFLMGALLMIFPYTGVYTPHDAYNTVTAGGANSVAENTSPAASASAVNQTVAASPPANGIVLAPEPAPPPPASALNTPMRALPRPKPEAVTAPSATGAKGYRLANAVPMNNIPPVSKQSLLTAANIPQILQNNRSHITIHSCAEDAQHSYYIVEFLKRHLPRAHVENSIDQKIVYKTNYIVYDNTDGSLPAARALVNLITSRFGERFTVMKTRSDGVDIFAAVDPVFDLNVWLVDSKCNH